MTSTVVSPDGSRIAFESFGTGPALLLVHGTSATRMRWAPVREKLATRYTVHDMDRRGRGGSAAEFGPYRLAREAEDVAAVAEAIGGDVYVIGHSYGALCVIEAALITSAFRRIVLYEPPMTSPGAVVVPPDTLASMKSATDPESILEMFYLNALQLPNAAVDDLKGTEIWQARLTAALTITREIDEVDEFQATDRLAKIAASVQMLLGTESPTYLRAATAAIAAQLQDVRIVAVQGQAHQAIDLDADQFVRLVFEFDSTTDGPRAPG
jgi:pimeloyl-ACP methyl ester carboxylesterase